MFKKIIPVIIIATFLGGCKKEAGSSGFNSLINIIPLSAGNTCPTGGVKIETGLDANRNGMLDPSEVTNSENLCNGGTGVNGHNSLIRTSTISSNGICQSGGLQIQSGIDVNDNGVLEDSEVSQTQFVCNGVNGIYDHQIAILVGYGFASNQITPYIYEGTPIKFNIANFPGVDSAIFVVRDAFTENSSSKINFKLYNSTDNIAFDNSLVSTNSTVKTLLQSPNILQSFPNKEIDLGLEVYSDINNINGSGQYFYLLLYRK